MSDLFDWQRDAVNGMARQSDPLRACLYFKTGGGKTLTALLGARHKGYDEALVVTPPATYGAWQTQAAALDMQVETISHAKFRMKDFKVSRSKAVITDEFHLLGGHGKQGWKKLDTMARHLQAPLLVLSATPNYNDAERVYCIQHVLDPHSCKGGYLEFLYRECITEQDPFSATPKVLGFQRFASAAEYLAALPYVYYLPDDLVWSIDDLDLSVPVEWAFEEYGYDRHTHRIMGSIIEAKHRRIFNALVEPSGFLNNEALDLVVEKIDQAGGPVLIFANHSTVAEAAELSLAAAGDRKVTIVTGDTPKKKRDARIQAFRDGVLDVLVGTATLATGTDGLDKVCDTLIILDDTDDDSLRRQLVGRIMPRGTSTDASMKKVFRIVLT
jgi:superfamily II DNA or RNA helicase